MERNEEGAISSATKYRSSAAAIPAQSVPYYVKACAMGIPAVMFGLLISAWIMFFLGWVPGSTPQHSDFRQLYVAGYMVRTGHAHQLYEYGSQKQFQDSLVSPEAIALPYIRPAFEAAMFVPISFLPYTLAYWLMLVGNCGLLVLVFYLVRPFMTNLATVWTWLPVALFLSFFPTMTSIIRGQDSISFLLLLTAASVTLGKKNEMIAGALLGLGLFKLQLALPIALLFLLWRRRRFVAGFSAVAVVLGALSIGLTGLAEFRVYARALVGVAQLSYVVSSPAQMMPNLHGFVSTLLGGWMPGVWIQIFTILLSLWLLVWTVIRGFRADARSQLLLAIPASVLVSQYILIHDLSVLLLPTVVLLDRYLLVDGQVTGLPLLICRAAEAMIVAPALQAFFPYQFYWVAVAIIAFWLAFGSAISVPRGKNPDISFERRVFAS